MITRSWIPQLLGLSLRPHVHPDRRRRQAPRAAPRRKVKLDWFALEDRKLLSNVTVLEVTSTADSGPGTLRAAVATANTSTIPVEIDFELTMGAEITLKSGQLELSNTTVPIAIDGPGAGLTISGNNASRVFLIDPNVTASISGLTITGGNPPSPGPYSLPEGGGVYNQGALTLEDVTVSGNTAMNNSDVTGAGGGVFNASSATATLINCSITGNIAGTEFFGGFGAGLFNAGTMTATGCTVSGNVGVLGSGLANYGTATLDGCSISGNLGYNGTVETGRGAATLTVAGCSISGNSGGGIVARYGTLSLTDSSVENNAYNTGVTAWNALTITDCTISGNSGQYGGGLAVGGPATITDCTISDNSSPSIYGGGVFLEAYSTATLTDCTISGNSDSAANGHPIHYDIAGGVDVSSGAVAALIGCTISGNSAPKGAGGGVGIDGMATLTNCTISGNSAAAGGGVFNYGTAALVACTVSGNSASQGGGVDNFSSPYYTSRTTLTDTIVAGNTTAKGGGAPSDIGGTDPGDVTGSYNLTGTGGSGGLTAVGHNVLGVTNPGLAPLGDYGGPTETMALLPGSPAIHNGTAVPGVTTDQRGFALDAPPDIGAFQTQPGPLVVDTAIDGLGSPPGELSLRQAVNLADVLTGGATITFDQSFSTKPSVITLTAGPLELGNATGAVAILGPGSNKLTVSGGGQSQDFEVNQGASAVISGLTITGGFSTGAGGGLVNLGTVTLADVEVEDNSAEYGGGIFNAGTLTVVDSDVSDNIASTEGGGLYNKGAPVLLIGTSIKHNKPDNIFGTVIQS
jgi:hypothetical protein